MYLMTRHVSEEWGTLSLASRRRCLEVVMMAGDHRQPITSSGGHAVAAQVGRGHDLLE